VIKTCFVHSCRCFSRNLCAKIPELTTLWCGISQTVLTNAFVDHGGFLLGVAIIWTRSFLRTAAVRYMNIWWLFTMVQIYSLLIACCFLLLLQPLLWTIFKCASWVIWLVAALAVSWCINWCLHSCCVPLWGVVRGCPLTAIMILDYGYQMHTYLRYA
jgi:hypothetical protein